MIPLLSFLLSLLSLLALLPPTSPQLLQSISGCPLTLSTSTANCSAGTLITLRGSAFPSSQRSFAAYVAATACASSSRINSTTVTCRLPKVDRRVVTGAWLDVYIQFERVASNHLAGVWYDAFNPPSSSSTSSALPFPSPSSTPRVSSASSARSGSSPSSPTSARAAASSSAGTPSTSTPTRVLSSAVAPPPPPPANSTEPMITGVSGCVDVGNRTANCTSSNRLTILGQRFSTSTASLVLRLGTRSEGPLVFSLNSTHLVCAVPPWQYEPYTWVTVMLYTAGRWTNQWAGLSFVPIIPTITSLRTGSSAPPDGIVRVLPGGSITVRGENFPRDPPFHALINGTQFCSTTVHSTSELVCLLPLQVSESVPRDVVVGLQLQGQYSQLWSNVHYGVMVVPTGPTIYSVSGCDDDGNRTQSCLLHADIPITVTGSRFPNTSTTAVRIGQDKTAVCNVSAYDSRTSRFVCWLPKLNFPVGKQSFFQVNVQWSGSEAASFLGLSFTDVLPNPLLTSITGPGCVWDGSVANNCSSGARITLAGEHFAPYITPRVSITDSAFCTLHSTSGTTRNVIVCTAPRTLPTNRVLPVQIALGGVTSRWYPAVSFRATSAVVPSSTGRGGGGAASTAGKAGGGTVGSGMTVEEELIVVGLAVTMGVVLVVGMVCGVGWWLGKREHRRETRGGPSEVGLDELHAALAHAPYVPLAAQWGGGVGERSDSPGR